MIVGGPDEQQTTEPSGHGIHGYWHEFIEFITALPLVEICGALMAICTLGGAWIGLKKLKRERRNNA